MKLSRFALQAVVAIFMISASSGYAQQKNILHLWFDTVIVNSVPTTEVMHCWYRIEGTKPHDFRGFDMRYIYETHQIDPTNVFFDGTACENAGFHTSSQNNSTGTGDVVVLSSNELNLKNPLLFSIAFQVNSTLNNVPLGDTIAMMEVVNFDLNIDSGIDSVHISNGWIKYVKLPPPPPEKKKAIELFSDSITITSDSLGFVSLQTTDIDSARIKRGVFTFTIDTSLVRFDTVIGGQVLANPGWKITLENKVSLVNIFFSNSDTVQALKGSGELLRMQFTAKHREDTLSTTLIDPVLFALNTDNLLDSVRYQIASIAVLGKKPIDTTSKTVSLDKGGKSFSISNTIVAAGNIEFYSENETPVLLKIYDMLGRCVLEQNMLKSVTLRRSAFASGMYKAVAITANGKERFSDLAIRFIVLH